ncbi:MAG: hypothetical protein WHX52_01110 [Anaerolineae bacterium]
MLEFDPEDVVAIHASSVFSQKGALLFLGPSGTGKTTACNLFGSHMEILAEDAVYLVPHPAPHPNNGWEVFCGDKFAHIETVQSFLERATALSHVPLRAIFRLRQAEVPRLEKIDPLLTCRYLTDAFFEVVQQRSYTLEVKRRAFSVLAEVARFLRGYEFNFDLSPKTLDILNREMELW